MKIVHIASEGVPFSKTGGLADVVGALPKALASLGDEVAVIMPLYGRKTDKSRYGIKPVAGPAGRVEIALGARKVKGRILECESEGVKIYFVSQPAFFDREEIYQTTAGDYPDNAARFIFFAHAAVEAMIKLQLKPDIVQAHDWQAALVPVYLKTLYRDAHTFENSKSLLTIHNLGYQGNFPRTDMELTGLSWDLFTFDKLESWGKLSILKGGIAFSDAINTVSRKYAHEILTDEQGMGLDGALAQRSEVLTGILNGIDYATWNPESDPFISDGYTPANMKGKSRCKAALLNEFKLKGIKDPLIGMVGRLTSQKGLDILAAGMIDIMENNLKLVILGTGENKYHMMLAEFAKKFPRRIGVQLAFDNRLAHLIEAGSDIFLMPSRYEPCGLNQMISLKYGTIPVVRATGGLDDTIKEFDSRTGKGNGFKFINYTPASLVKAVDRAVKTYAKGKLWTTVVSNAMECDFSWSRSAAEYRKLYKKMMKRGKT